MTASRLKSGGRLIDRAKKVSFRFNGRRLKGFAGDTLAAALLANDVAVLGRSFKYHRKRGLLSAGPEEPNALLTIGSGATRTPNARATMVPLGANLTATSQNHWPSLHHDIGALNNRLARFFPAGFYYKTFIHPRFAWKHLFEPIIRRQAGLGKPPTEADPDAYEHLHLHVDVLIAGGGVAGLQAALAAGQNGASVLLCEAAGHWGGRAPVDGAEIDGVPADAWVKAALDRLAVLPNVRCRLDTTVTGLYDHGYALACEQLTGDGPTQRLWRVRAQRTIVATGAIERPLMFAGNDLPGVMLASAVRDYLVNNGVAAGKEVVLATASDDAYRTAIALQAAGVKVAAILDARAEVTGALPEKARALGLRILPGTCPAQAIGKARLSAVAVTNYDSDGAQIIETIPCDCLAMSGGWSPAVHLWSQIGGKLTWDAHNGFFRPDAIRGPTAADGLIHVFCCGAANGQMSTGEALTDGQTSGMTASASLEVMGRVADAGVATLEPAAAPLHVRMLPKDAPIALRQKAFVDFQHDVKVSDIQLAAREGYESVEHAKRYTTLGMATDQGKTSNINGLSVLAETLGREIPEVGTTTFRPPYVPVTMGAIAGEARGALFQPLRKTALHDWHLKHGASMEPVGLWHRPYAYLQTGETRETAVQREVTAVRQAAGILDGSTLGKILVAGPDAGRFLDMLYTNVMSNLEVGRCRYGLMCNENGFLIDDGVVARLAPDQFLCHTTSGGADRIHAMMEDWLQCEWWTWKVWIVNQTEHFGQIVLAGPQARDVLLRVAGGDIRPAALPFMSWKDMSIASFEARVFRISFSGELSYEIAVRTRDTLPLWERLIEEGRKLGGRDEDFALTPYGTEALHVLRAEKGYIMIGDETDGTVTPQDLGLSWAISKKKTDFIGKRGQERSFLASPDRLRLVGLETLDGSVLPVGALALGRGLNDNRQRVTEGRVTSSYFSPTLGKGIALGLVKNGPERGGEVLNFAVKGLKSPVKVKIVSPAFYDPEGTRLNV